MTERLEVPSADIIEMDGVPFGLTSIVTRPLPPGPSMIKPVVPTEPRLESMTRPDALSMSMRSEKRYPIRVGIGSSCQRARSASVVIAEIAAC